MLPSAAGLGALAVASLVTACAPTASLPSPTSAPTPDAIVAPSASTPVATAAPSGTVEMEGVELVRATVDLELQPTLELPGLPATVPAGSLLVRFDEAGRDDMSLVVPVLEGGIMPAWTAIDPALMVPEAPDCPDGELTVPALYELGQSAALCFGSLPFTFGGFLPGACGVADVPVSGEPDWLNDFAAGVTLYGQRVRQGGVSQPPASGWVSAKRAPGVSFANCDEALAGQFHLVTAHFDDPASTTCRTESQGQEEAAAASIARCRLTMVITATEPLPNR